MLSHKRSGLPLYFVGFSLGAALSTIGVAHTAFELDMPVKALYTFGSPRVGDGHFANNLALKLKAHGTKTFRFVNEGDIVNSVPRYKPAVAIDGVFEPFRHLGERDDERRLAILLTKGGALEAAPRSRCGENPALVECDPKISDLPSLVRNREAWLAEHAIERYVDKLRELAKIAP